MGVWFETCFRRRGDVMMGPHCYVLLRHRYNIPIRHCGDVPLSRLGDVPSRRCWVFHLRRTYDVAETCRETSLRRCHDVLMPGEETATTDPKWHWNDCSQVMLAQLSPGDIGAIVSKCILTFYFVFCFVTCSLALFFTSEFHLGKILSYTRIMTLDPNIEYT